MGMINISQDELVAHLRKSGIIKKENKSIVPMRNVTKQVEETKSVTINPFNRLMQRGGKNVIEPNRKITYQVLRTVSEKAWIINLIIGHLIAQTRPFMKASTDNNVRGYQVRLKDKDHAPNAKEKELIKTYTEFFQRTGFGVDPEREDNLVNYSAKIIRDALTLDQVTTEIQRTRGTQVYAFWAIDPATIYKCSEEGYNGDDKIKFIQEIDLVTTAYYTRDDLIFDYQHPRSDVNHSGYGYSVVEQAIDLITGMINSYIYNMGFFTEDKLPRGMLLLQGDADMEEVEAIEDYLVNIMSGGPSSKWRVPIIPAGSTSGENGKKFEWVNLQGSNKDMEFSQWMEFIWSSVAAMFGVDLEELGIKTSKSTSVMGDNTGPKIEASKSRGLSSTLSFCESHFQKILDKIDPRFDFEFVGYERDDPTLKNATREADLRTFKTIDELRAEDDKKPFNQPWSTVPLNPYVVQLIQSAQQQQDGQGGPEDGMPPEGSEEQGREGDDQGGEEQDAYRKLMMGDENESDDAEDDGPNESNTDSDARLRPPSKEELAGRKGSIYDQFKKSIIDDVIEIIV